MGITDELKQRIMKVRGINFDDLECLLLMMKRIDQAHTSALQCAHDAGFDEGFASADDWEADHADELAEHGWMRMPVDADGVPIRIGDKIDVYQTKNVEVVGVGDQMVFTHYYMGDYHKHFAGDCRHHHEPTVEDVLREFATECEDAGNAGPEVKRLAAEYAERIREVR